MNSKLLKSASVDETAQERRRSAFGLLLDALSAECKSLGIWNNDMAKDLPKKWEKHGDMVLLPENAFSSPNWRMMGRRLWKIVADSLQVERVGRKKRIASDEFRTPHIDLLYGEHGWTEHKDNGIRYQYDVTKCMFSIGNISEKIRIAEMDCKGEVVVDLFAGIGYFSLPYLVHSGASHLYACEWNPDALEALRRNLEINKVGDRCTVLEGDCRKVCPHGVADRVNMGLLPTAHSYWMTACKALRPTTGGIMLIHENVTSTKAPTPPREADSSKNVQHTAADGRRRQWAGRKQVSADPIMGSFTNEACADKSNGGCFGPKNASGKKQPDTIIESVEAEMARSDSVAEDGEGSTRGNCSRRQSQIEAEIAAAQQYRRTSIDSYSLLPLVPTNARDRSISVEREVEAGRERVRALNRSARSFSCEEDCSAASMVEDSGLVVESEGVDSPSNSTSCSSSSVSNDDHCHDLETIVDVASAGNANGGHSADGKLSGLSISRRRDGVGLKESIEIDKTELEQRLSASDSGVDLDAAGGEDADSAQEGDAKIAKPPPEERRLRRKLSAIVMQSIDEESQKPYLLKIDRDFVDRWETIDPEWRSFSLRAAQQILRFLNNLHDAEWSGRVLRVGKIKSYAPHIDHLVLDLECRPAKEMEARYERDWDRE